jgi:hypothetical protein
MTITRFITCSLAALTVAGSLAATRPAIAGERLSPGAAVAIGVLGGLAVGGAIAASQPPGYYPPAPVYAPPPPPIAYEPAPVYYAPPPRPVYVERCFIEGYSEWVPGWGWQPRRREVCR